MKKRSILAALLILVQMVSFVPVWAEEENAMARNYANETIDAIASQVNLSQDEVDKYLSEYDRVNDFIYDLIQYKRVRERNPDSGYSFDGFRAERYAKAAEPIAQPAAQSDIPGIVLMPPEQETRDYREYVRTNADERINYATGVLSHEETDFVLPGVNGLDFALTARFNPDEAALYSPALVPTFDYPDSPTYTTWMFPNHSEAEVRSRIGRGWGFALPYVVQDKDFPDWYYIRLADGSTKSIKYGGILREGVTFEVRKGGDYVITYKNGTKDYLNHIGLIKTEDRYGNQIQYFYANDGSLEKVVDSVNRNITFRRTQLDDHTIRVQVFVDDTWMCNYWMEDRTHEIYMLYLKETRNTYRYYTYDSHEVNVKVPMANKSDVNTVFTISSIVNPGDKYTCEYEYRIGEAWMTNDSGSGGYREYMRIKSRKTVGNFSCQGEVVDEVQYQYAEDGEDQWNHLHEVKETVVQTGLQTLYVSDESFSHIESKTITAPDSDVTIDIAYTYGKYWLMDSYTQRTYSDAGEFVVTEAFEYDEMGNVISHTDKFGTQRKYSYDADTSVMTKMQEPLAWDDTADVRFIINKLDRYGNIVTSSIADYEEDNIVQTVTYTYDSHGNVLSKQTSPAHMEPEYFEYTDDHANVKKHSMGDTVTEYTYDAFGRMISETNSLGQTTRYTYNTRNEVVEIIYPDNTNIKNVYAKDIGYIYLNNVYFDEKGPVKREEIDDFERVTTVYTMPILESQSQYQNIHHYEDMDAYEELFYETFWLPWQEMETIQYDSIGRVTQVANRNGATKYTYDAFNRVIQIVNPDLSEKRIEYDDIARTRTVYDEEGNRTMEKYDAENRVIEQTIFPEENRPITQRFEYDRKGNLVAATDYNGNTTEWYYDVFERKSRIVNAMGENVYMQYADDFSYVTEFYLDGVSEQVRQQTSYYDTYGRLSAVADEYYNVENYWYDTQGNIVEHMDKNGDITKYTYNNRNAATNIAKKDADKSYVYDEAGKVRAVETRKANAQGTLEKENRIQYNYRTDGLVNDETAGRLDGMSRVTFNTQYDELSSPVSFTIRTDTWQQIKQTKYTKDNMDRVSKIGQTAAGINSKNIGCEYYANGWLKKETLPNGYANTYAYDGAGRMTELERTDTDGRTIMHYSYTYDNNGNRTGIVETDRDGAQTITVYTYDKRNRLVKEENGHSGTTTTYQFDIRNNIT